MDAAPSIRALQVAYNNARDFTDAFIAAGPARSHIATVHAAASARQPRRIFNHHADSG
jgi:hypothetical protein